jgi:hypothetical protein
MCSDGREGAVVEYSGCTSYEWHEWRRPRYGDYATSWSTLPSSVILCVLNVFPRSTDRCLDLSDRLVELYRAA